jgi:vacuolar-type H+-ATPase subunit E/Vma4
VNAIGGSIASVVAAVRDRAEAELERIGAELAGAFAALEREAPVDGAWAAEIAARTAETRERAREKLAQEDWRDSREALESRERWLQRAVEEGRRRLREREAGPDGPELLLRLAAEGLSYLPGDGFEVAVAAPVSPRLDAEWFQRLRDRCGKLDIRLAPSGAGCPDGGCVVRTVDGRMAFDNSYEARARRFESAWRSALAAMYG